MVWHDGRVSLTRLFICEVAVNPQIISMLSGLALESMITLLTVKYVQIFLLLWIISTFYSPPILIVA
jgi:hypothetical protein